MKTTTENHCTHAERRKGGGEGLSNRQYGVPKLMCMATKKFKYNCC